MPLSEDEQRILREMEQNLYSHGKSFADRLRASPATHRPVRWSVALFAIGFAIVLLAFSSSLALATFGFLVMLLAALFFERSLRSANGRSGAPRSRPRPSAKGNDSSSVGRRLRSRFFQQH